MSDLVPTSLPFLSNSNRILGHLLLRAIRVWDQQFRRLPLKASRRRRNLVKIFPRQVGRRWACTRMLEHRFLDLACSMDAVVVS